MSSFGPIAGSYAGSQVTNSRVKSKLGRRVLLVRQERLQLPDSTTRLVPAKLNQAVREVEVAQTVGMVIL